MFRQKKTDFNSICINFILIMLRTIKSSTQILSSVKTRMNFPKKFKGTIIEKWADYWKNLVIDYQQMLQDLRTDIQDDPKKGFKWVTGLAAVYLLSRNNPNEADFRDNIRTITNEVILVSEECQNPKAIEHLRFLQICYNEGVIHYKTFGIFSVMYLSEFNDTCSLYKAQCSYMKPSYISLPSKIIDVGLLGRWWNIYVKSTDYDINEII